MTKGFTLVNETYSVTKYNVMSLQKDMKKIEEILTETVQSKAHVSKRLTEDYFRGGTLANDGYYLGKTHNDNVLFLEKTHDSHKEHLCGKTHDCHDEHFCRKTHGNHKDYFQGEVWQTLNKIFPFQNK